MNGRIKNVLWKKGIRDRKVLKIERYGHNMELDRYCVGERYTIKEVLEQFESYNHRVAIVTNASGKVIGVVSQGDILRALSAGQNLYTPVNQIIQNSFLHLYEKDMEKAYPIFKKKKISLLPVIDQSNKLIDFITIEDIYEYLENTQDHIG